MAEKLGIENVKKCLALLIEGGNVCGEIGAMPHDAKWYQKIVPVAKILDEVYDLTKVNFKEVIPEFKDVDEAEKAEFVIFFNEKFDIPQDEIEAKIEAGLNLLIKTAENIVAIIDFAKSFKKIEQN